MAQKRMFDKRIVEIDKFIDMPMSAKALYFLLGMYADDRGFVSPRYVMRMHGSNDDDLKLLVMKRYLIYFESGVVVITDWNKNNWLDKRRIQETEFIDEYKSLKMIEERYCLANAKPMLRENRIEENRIEENRTTTIYEFLEKNFGRTIAPIEFEKIETWLLSFNEDIIMYAIEICVMNNKKVFSYLEGILKNWKSKGYKLLQEIKDNEKSKDKTKDNVPEWFDTEIKQEKMTIKDEKEMEDLLKDFKKL